MHVFFQPLSPKRVAYDYVAACTTTKEIGQCRSCGLCRASEVQWLHIKYEAAHIYLPRQTVVTYKQLLESAHWSLQQPMVTKR